MYSVVGEGSADRQPLGGRADNRWECALLDLIASDADHLIALYDAELRIQYCNEAFAREVQQLWGVDLRPGMALLDALRPWPGERAKARRLWRRALEGESFTITEAFGPGEGDRQFYELSFSPLYDAEGMRLGAAQVVRNVTRRQRAEASLRETQDRLCLAQRTAGVGVFDWNISSGRITWSATLEALFGLPEGGFEGGFDDWAQRVEPADLPRLLRDVGDWMAERRVEVAYEYRFRRADDTVRWAEGRARFEYDAHGCARRMVGTNMDITERKEAEHALRDASRRKDAFLATLSHELRNPLAPLRNGIALLRRPEVAAAGAEDLLDMMERQLDHVVRIVEDLSDVSRIARGKLVLAEAPLDLREVVGRAVEMCQPAVEDAGGTLAVDLPEASLPLRGDAVRLVQVVTNLLNNAARHIDPGGRIEVRARRLDSIVMLSVRDDGDGMPPELLASVFELFKQAPEGRRGGAGIGLHLCRSLVELHGGTIEACSDGPGHGSALHVSLPVAGAATRAQSAAQDPRPAPAPDVPAMVTGDRRRG